MDSDTEKGYGRSDLNDLNRSRNKRRNSSRKVRFLLLVFCLGIAYLLWLILGGCAVPCAFHLLTGLKCPGCGITAMILALTRLDFAAALRANAYLFVTSPILLALLFYYAFKWIRGEKFTAGAQGLTAIYCAGLLLFGILRNLPL